MIQTILRTVAGSVAVLLLSIASLAIVPSATYAQNLDGSVRCGSDINLDKTNCSKDDLKKGGVSNATRIENVIKTVINIFSAIVGAVSIIMIILGGFKYITSSGDSNNISSAKNTILYAIVGLVVVAFAQVIVQFVLERTA